MAPRDEAPHLRYGYPLPLVLRIGWALLCGRRRAFPADAAHLYRTITPAPRVEGLEHWPRSGSAVVVFNHYYSRSFPSWWNAIVIAALMHSRQPLAASDVAWVMTGAWTYPDALRRHVLTPLTQWAFARLARVYGFVAMPPMPPRRGEVEARAYAVRRVLAMARRAQPPFIGLSPEGHDSPDASLIVPPAGVGRFLLLLTAELPLVPVGVYEEGAQLTVRFGAPFTLRAPPGMAPHARDAWAGEQAMLAIGRLLPATFWGAYRSKLS